MKKAIVLLSGGMDSTTCLAIAKSKGFKCVALSFSYAKRQSFELEAAKKIAAYFDATHQIFDLDLHAFQTSSLINEQLSIPENFSEKGIPSTYVPARNTIFLAIALGFAETFDIQDIFIGVSSVDYSGYPDCRPEYIKAFEVLANLGTKQGVEGKKIEIHAPLQYLSKSETISLGNSLDVDYRMTVSCYQANSQGEACGKCESCHLRKKGFEMAGLLDVTRYQ